MSNNGIVNKCPNCGKFIFGDHCYTCDYDINTPEIPDFFKNIFSGFSNNERDGFNFG